MSLLSIQRLAILGSLGLVLGAAVPAWSQVILSPEQGNHTSLVGHMDYLEDTKGDYAIGDVVLRANDFIDAGPNIPNFQFTESAYWFRFSLTNQTRHEVLILEISYPLLDDVQFFQPLKSGKFSQSIGGDGIPFIHRARPHRTINFELNLEPNSTETFYLRVKTAGSLQVPVNIHTEEHFFEAATTENTIMGLYYGVLIVMILFNGLLWFRLRDSLYGYYLGYLSFYLLMQLCINGNALRYLFPTSPILAGTLLLSSGWAAFGFAFIFTRHFLNLDENAPRLNSLFKVLTKVFLAFAILSLVLPYSLGVKIGTVAFITIPPIFIATGIIVKRQGYRPASIFLCAWMGFVIGVVIYGAKSFNLLPANLFTEYAIQVGSALEVILLTLALADRIHVLQEANESKQELLIEQATFLAQENLRRSEVEASLNRALKTRLYLVGDWAHRINNPLNVAHGGNEAGKSNLLKLKTLVLSFFPSVNERNQQELKVIEQLEDFFGNIEDGLHDSILALSKASHNVADLRALGGASGESPEPIDIRPVYQNALNRVNLDLGAKSSERIHYHETDSLPPLAGQHAVLSVVLAGWLKHGLSRLSGDETMEVTPIPTKDGNYIWLEARAGNGGNFETHVTESISTQDIILGLVGNQGAAWREDPDPNGKVTTLALRLASSEEAWFQAQGGRDRK